MDPGMWKQGHCSRLRNINIKALLFTVICLQEVLLSPTWRCRWRVTAMGWHSQCGVCVFMSMSVTITDQCACICESVRTQVTYTLYCTWTPPVYHYSMFHKGWYFSLFPWLRWRREVPTVTLQRLWGRDEVMWHCIRLLTVNIINRFVFSWWINQSICCWRLSIKLYFNVFDDRDVCIDCVRMMMMIIIIIMKMFWTLLSRKWKITTVVCPELFTIKF